MSCKINSSRLYVDRAAVMFPEYNSSRHNVLIFFELGADVMSDEFFTKQFLLSSQLFFCINCALSACEKPCFIG